jgi:hypothetical protein
VFDKLLQNAGEKVFAPVKVETVVPTLDGLGVVVPNRESLHELIATLPEAALESAERVLQSYQTWPPRLPMGVEKMHQRVDELLKRRGEEWAARNRTGYVSVHMGRGSFKPDGDGMASASTMDGPDLVNFEIRIFCGHRLELEERLHLSEDEKSLVYTQQIKGPREKEGRYEMEFEVAEGLPPVERG